MTIILPRRKFLAGLGATLFCAPAIVRASSLMAVRPIPSRTTCCTVDVAIWSSLPHQRFKNEGVIRIPAGEQISKGDLIWIDSLGRARLARSTPFSERVHDYGYGRAIRDSELTP